MRNLFILCACALWCAGCGLFFPNQAVDSDGGPSGDLRGCPMPDLTPPPPKCAAAKSLAGDNLFCVDFLALTSLADLPTWNFKAGGPLDCWDLAVGTQTGSKVLLIKNFSIYIGDCAFTTPQIDLNLPQNKKYNSLTISILQTVDVNPATANNGPQYAQVFLNNTTFLVNETTNKNNPNQLMLSIDKAKMPAMPSGGHQFYVNFHAPYPAGGGNLGWEIQSIAVMGNP